jgi:type I restriction enzyme R subunit
MDIILPDPSATPFLPDLKKLGKISIGTRNRYRDEQLNISGAGEKVRQLIEEHIFSTGVDPKIAPVDLLAKDFKQKLNEHKSSRAKASEIENAIKHHIKINLEEDPDYYRPLSERLNEIIRQNADKWDELVQLLMDFRKHIESDHKNDAQKLGLSETEYAFHNILMTEISIKSGEAISEETHHQVIAVVKQLVAMMDEATAIIGFFEKWDEQKRVRKEIKRTILDQPFGSPELVNAISDRFMELAKVKFK